MATKKSWKWIFWLWLSGFSAYGEADCNDVKEQNGNLVLPDDNAVAAVVIFPGAYLKPERYLDLARAIKSAAGMPLSVYLSRFSFEIGNPIEAKKRVQPAIDEMAQKGFTHPARRVFLTGHSQGGITAAMAAPSMELGGLILLGAYIPRTVVIGSSLKEYPLPVMTLGGDLDGLTGVPFIAREYRSYLEWLASGAGDAYQKPVILLPGFNHMSFVDAGQFSGDLRAEIPMGEAHGRIAALVDSFIRWHLSLGRDAGAVRVLDQHLARTDELLRGFLVAQRLDEKICAEMQIRVAGYAEGSRPAFDVQQRTYAKKSESFGFIMDKAAFQEEDGEHRIIVPTFLEFPLNLADISSKASLAPAVIACKMKNRDAIDLEWRQSGPEKEPTCAELNAEAVRAAFALLRPQQKARFLSRHG
ncbi:MAG: hypothetical protein HQK54_17445, partial [Oligoflexales bacterium]|nr:hypothetical protein [Oligoflexales bacterium]